MIRVYGAQEREFLSNGMGTIMPLSCLEEKQISLNGWYIDVTADISYADKLLSGNIVLAKTKEKGVQPFRIKSPDKKDKKISFRAHHVAFDADNYILDDVRPENLSCDSFMKYINERTDAESPFQVSGNAFGISTHYFVRKSLLEAFSIIQEEEFDCLFDFDRFRIMCMAPSDIGKDEGFSVVYGKNIQGVKIFENWDDVCTKVMPVGPNGLTIPELYVKSDIQYEIPYTKVKNFEIETENENGEDLPLEEQYNLLREAAHDFLKEHSVPKISYNIKSDVPQELRINDTVYIKHPLFTISAHVQSYTYDCLSGRVKTLTFGNYDPSIKNRLQKEIVDAASSAASESGNKVYRTLKQRISESGGLYATVEILDDGSEKTYLHNKKNLEESDIIITVNDEGLFVSSDSGETWYGIDMGGAAFLRFLEAATISAEKINGGILSSRAKDPDGTPVTMIDLDQGDYFKFGPVATVSRASGNVSKKWVGD